MSSRYCFHALVGLLLNYVTLMVYWYVLWDMLIAGTAGYECVLTIGEVSAEASRRKN